MNENKKIEQQKDTRPWVVRHWKGLTAIAVIIFVVFIGYIITAGVGASEFAKNSTVSYQEVEGNFKDWGGAFNWYFNVVWIDNFLGVPPILLGVFSFVGYIVLKRGFSDSLIGAIKTAIGVLLLNIGSSWLSGMVSPLFTGLSNLLKNSGSINSSVITLDPYTGWSSGYNFLDSFSNNTYVSWVSYSLLIGFAFNLILVSLKKWTNCHAVMTTGHIMFQQSAVVVPIVYILFFQVTPLATSGDASVAGGSATAGTIIFSGIFLGTYWSVATTATIKQTNIVTENANFAIGHQQMLATTTAYKLGRFFKFTKKGKPVVSAEERKLSRRFRIFEDNIFVQSLLIMALFLILAIILQCAGNKDDGTTFVSIVNSNTTWWLIAQIGTFWFIQVIFGALLTVAAILAIQTGVRMFVTELQQSFQGISESVIPGAVVAVDIAAVYGFSPNAVTYGFLAGIIAQYVGVGVMIGLTFAGCPTVIVVPLFITLFFNSGAVGIYANIEGGWKAAIAVPALIGFVEIIVISFALGQLNNAVDRAIANGAILADAQYYSPVMTGFNGMGDWNLFFGFPLIFASMSEYAAYVLLPLEIVALFAYAQFIDTGMTKTEVSPLLKYVERKKEQPNLAIQQSKE